MSTETSIIVYREGSGKSAKTYAITIGKIYVVGNKRDANAPDGFQALGATKLPDPNIGVKMCNLSVADPDKHTKTRAHFDTFMTDNSRRVRRMYPEASERKAFLDLVQEHILGPVEDIYGTPGILAPTNAEFWNSQDGRKEIFDKEIFNTNDAIDLFHLYMLLMNRELAPEDFQSRPTYGNAQFTVVDYDMNIDVKAERDFAKATAVSRFMTTGTQNIAQATTLLDYIGIYAPAEGESLRDLVGVFNEWLGFEHQNVRLFNQTYEDLMVSKSGKDLLETFAVVKGLIGTGDIVKQYGQYIFNDEEMGQNARDIANKVVRDKDLKKKILELASTK